MLMVLCVDVFRDSRSEGIGFAILGNVDLQDTSEAYFELDAAILVEIIVPDVF